MPARSLTILLTDLVDYAGLFPPAKLGMGDAAAAFHRARIGVHEWMLGRFVCPVSRLRELSEHASAIMPGTNATSGYQEMLAGEPWRVSALIDGDIEASIDTIGAFNEYHDDPANGLAMIDMVELKPANVEAIDDALDALPEDLYPFFELPVNQDCRGFVAALAGEAAAAKIRTGGVAPNAFPTPQEVVAFLRACAAADVPFKATAGLHHPVRGSFRLTYEPASPCHTMYGFFNIFIAAALIRAKGLSETDAIDLLTEEDPAAFEFSNDLVVWKSHGLEAARLAAIRETFALSFGSCSFEEPAADLTRLGLLEPT